MKIVGMVLGAIFGVLFVQSIPDIARYIKIRSM
ncbi:hypothetical protein BH18ACT5_BH18ACT5_14220 [soil metagenome]